MEPPEDPSSPSRKIPKVVLGLAVVAIVGPLFLLRRLHARSARLDLELPAPPVRRAGSIGAVSIAPVPGPSASSTSGGSFGFSGEDDDDWGVRPPPLPEGIEEEGSQLANTLYAFKAIGVATAVVLASGAGLVFGAKTLLGVQDTDDFARRIRAVMPHAMPVLNERMDTSLKNDASTGSDAQAVLQTGEPAWTWTEAQVRLTRAYDEGGAARWTEQLAREAEAEARVELAKRQRAAQTHTQRIDDSRQQ